MKKHISLRTRNILIGLFSILGSVIISSTVCILIYLLNPDVTDFSVENPPSVDYVIVLGGGIKNNGTLPSTVKNRCNTTVAFYDQISPQNKMPPVIVTGGTLHKKKYAEAPAIKSYLVENGIPESIIFTEMNALDTIQNLKYSVDVISSTQNITQEQVLNSNVLIVTNFFHLNRAEFIAQKLGYENVMGLAAKTPFSKSFYCYSREILAYVKLSFRILITGEPKHL